MSEHKYRNVNWDIETNYDGSMAHGAAQLAVLMDIRAELQKLNSLLYCSNFIGIPQKLEQIRKNTVKPREKKKR